MRQSLKQSKQSRKLPILNEVSSTAKLLRKWQGINPSLSQLSKKLQIRQTESKEYLQTMTDESDLNVSGDPMKLNTYESFATNTHNADNLFRMFPKLVRDSSEQTFKSNHFHTELSPVSRNLKKVGQQTSVFLSVPKFEITPSQ